MQRCGTRCRILENLHRPALHVVRLAERSAANDARCQERTAELGNSSLNQSFLSVEQSRHFVRRPSGWFNFPIGLRLLPLSLAHGAIDGLQLPHPSYMMQVLDRQPAFPVNCDS